MWRFGVGFVQKFKELAEKESILKILVCEKDLGVFQSRQIQKERSNKNIILNIIMIKI